MNFSIYLSCVLFFWDAYSVYRKKQQLLGNGVLSVMDVFSQWGVCGNLYSTFQWFYFPQMVLQEKQMNLLLHPVFRRLLQVKWENFARTKHMCHLLSQFFFVLIWSVVAITTPAKSVSEFDQPLGKVWWRMVLESIAVLMTLFFIIQVCAFEKLVILVQLY